VLSTGHPFSVSINNVSSIAEFTCIHCRGQFLISPGSGRRSCVMGMCASICCRWLEHYSAEIGGNVGFVEESVGILRLAREKNEAT
jgi:hypothetical protein